MWAKRWRDGFDHLKAGRKLLRRGDAGQGGGKHFWVNGDWESLFVVCYRLMVVGLGVGVMVGVL
ncbi:MAG: hypothetical protein AAGC74_12750 [Verrucomicrobiota bacterium]